jgi:hypothetical protein
MKALVLSIFILANIFPTSAQVFTGGFSDGYASNNYLQTVNNIFSGSTADGWTTHETFTGNSAYVCAGGSRTLSADTLENTYQWQLNTGSGFLDISDNANYRGAATVSLQLQNIPSSYYGYQYRCLVNGVAGVVYTLKIAAYWTGNTNTAWENANNWGCGVVPDANTDVFIFGGKSNYPIINNNTSCRSISSNKNTSLAVSLGRTILLTGIGQ